MCAVENSMGKMRDATLTVEALAAFRKTIQDYYERHRRQFPWRETADPYHILVSEIMLQQTQTDRVLPKYDQFLVRFPDVDCLAQAELREILEVWQGLGYNRRALSLQRIARLVGERFGGRIPDRVETLRTFPGIGQATAGAVVAFGFNRPEIFIETNIRRVFLHFFFPGMERVRDKDILPLIEQTMDRVRPRHWYYALMDYGVRLKKTEGNPNRRSAHYHRQAPFEDSDRQIRGLIVKTLLEGRELNEDDLVKALKKSPKRTKGIIRQLVAEGFLTETSGCLRIAH
jgi:A/G-specific adenine glycosylase